MDTNISPPKNIIVLMAKSLINFVDPYYEYLLSFFQRDNYTIHILSSNSEIEQLTFTQNDIVLAIFLHRLSTKHIQGAYKVVCWLTDLHNQHQFQMENVAYSDAIFSSEMPYKIIDVKEGFRHLINATIVGFGWSVKIPPTLTFNDAPIPKILLSGAIGSFYPLREYLLNIHKRQPDKIAWFPHQGYDIGCSKKKHIDEFYFVLNRYLCCFCDAGNFRHVFKKNIEIIASGALLLADLSIKDILSSIGFKGGINCMFTNRDTMLSKIDYILNPDNRTIIDDMRRKGMELSKQFEMDIHTYPRVLEELHKL